MSRILFSAVPGYGHVHPLLPLASAYRERGHEVAFATGPELCEPVRRHGFDAWPTGLSMAETERRYLSRFPDADRLPPAERLRMVLPHMFVDIAARSRARDLVSLAERWRPDVVVHDVAEFAAPLAALATGARLVTHGVSLRNPTDDDMVAVGVTLDPLYAEWGALDGVAALLRSTYVDLCPPSLAGAEGNPFPDVRRIRPQLPALRPEDALPVEMDRMPYDLSVHVTLGTVVNDTPGVFEAILAGLRGEPINVVVAVGPDVDPKRFGPQPDNVLLARYLPYSLLLPRCAAVVSHAGAGTTLAALSYGLPSVLLPRGAEQFVNAHATSGAGAAVTVPPERLTPSAVRDAVRYVLASPRYADAAGRISAEIAAMGTAAELVDELLPGRAPTRI